MEKFASALNERREDHLCGPNVSLQAAIDLAPVHGYWLGR